MSKIVRTGNLPKGDYGGHVQALAPSLTDHQKLTVGASSVRSAALSADIYRIASNTGCYIKFGDDAVDATANDIYFPAGVEVLVLPETATNLAVIQDSAGGTITITAMGVN